MKTVIKRSGWIILWVCVSVVSADTFKHKVTGEVFTGFATQKSTGGKTLVFNKEANKMMPVTLYDYEVAYDTQGRRDSVVLIQITQPEILLSQTVSEKVASAIIDASNTGPQAILVQIDNPGGRGDYMSLIATALSETTNCPTAAYISGGSYGGAFSSAAILTLACQKVYIAPNASIGAVGPGAGTPGAAKNYKDYLLTYSPDSLAAYSTYISTLAQKHNRPALPARALADKRLSVVEVINNDGTREFIQKDDRQPTQTIVRTLAAGTSAASAGTAEVSPSDVVGGVLNLTPQDAVAVGLADKIAASIGEILADMKVSDVKVTNAGGIDSLIKKYLAARRNIAQGLARIDRIEEQTTTLDEQFYALDKQLRTGTLTREVTQGGNEVYRRRSGDRTPLNYNRSYTDENVVISQNNTDQMNRTRSPRTESVTMVEPTANLQVVRAQLTNALRDLVAEYRKVINLANRWPGGLPAEVPLETLQKNMDSASAQLDNLYRYQPVYQYQGPQQTMGRPNR
jgi:membrane-bound ClpP family serine protease